MIITCNEEAFFFIFNYKVVRGVVPTPNIEVGDRVKASLFESVEESNLEEGIVIMKIIMKV